MVVGGKALGRSSGDTDIWVECGVDYKHPTPCDLCYMPKEIMESFSPSAKEGGIASKEDMLAIKKSHLPYDIFWWKHAQDVLVLQKEKVSVNKELYGELIPYWEEQHGTKTNLSLYKTKGEFFNDAVVKHFDHDHLHTLVAKEGVPVYTRCLVDGQEVLIDKEKFYSMPHEDQVRMFKEEVAVIALERWIIPSLMKQRLTKGGNRVTILRALQQALHKTVVSLTKGWASRFIVDNLIEFIAPLQEEMLYALNKTKLLEEYMTNKISMEQLTALIKENMTYEKSLSEWVKRYYGEKYPNKTQEEVLEIAREEEVSLSDLLLKSEFVVHQDGGYEGGSEYCESVLLIDGTYYMVLYSYYSHHGFDFDDAEVFIVQPKEKTITVFE